MTKFIEYRVRPVTRYIVTRFWREDDASCGGAGSETHGEFDNYTTAYAVAYALCKQEHERLGWAPDDERIKYPNSVHINIAGTIYTDPSDIAVDMARVAAMPEDPQDAIMAEAMEPQPLVKP